MKEKRYAAVALPEEEVAVEEFGDEDFDWSRMSQKTFTIKIRFTPIA